MMAAIMKGKQDSCPGVALRCQVLSEKQIRAQLPVPQAWSISESWSKKTVATVSYDKYWNEIKILVCVFVYVCMHVCMCVHVCVYVC